MKKKINKYSLHIGINSVDNKKYKEIFGTLNNAENDAKFYKEFACSKGFSSTVILGSEATSNNVFCKINEVRKIMKSEDLFFITYAGHGTRVNDWNEDELEKDNYDEALVLSDRMIIDDELKILWQSFKKNSRIFFLTDSCLNGNVSRILDSFISENFSISGSDNPIRGIDTELVFEDFEKNIEFYKSIKKEAGNGNNTDYSLIHIASCQNNQLAFDGDEKAGKSDFTAKFQELLIGEKFSGTYRTLFNALVQRMPAYQTPNWDNHNVNLYNNFEKNSAFE